MFGLFRSKKRQKEQEERERLQEQLRESQKTVRLLTVQLSELNKKIDSLTSQQSPKKSDKGLTVMEWEWADKVIPLIMNSKEPQVTFGSSKPGFPPPGS